MSTGYPHTLRPELHKALMAHGIDYWVAQGITFWNCSDGRECAAYGYQANGKPTLAVKIVGIADPEQAIAATLGAGECRYEWSLADNGWADHTCSACGYVENTDIHVGLDWNFCPNCGRRVVE